MSSIHHPKGEDTVSKPSFGVKVSRGQLMFPINRPEFVEKAWTRNADIIALDLEDSVSPEDKATARALVRSTLPVVSKGGAEVRVRINKALWKEDVEASIWPGLGGIHFPKTESSYEVKQLDVLITRLEQERNIPEGTVEVIPRIESAKGIRNAYEIAASSRRVKTFGGVAFGDTTISLGVKSGCKDRDLLGYGNAETQWAADALGLIGEGKVGAEPFLRGLAFADYSTPEDEFVGKLALARRLGFRGGRGIHPAQVKAMVKGYTPTESEVREARKVVEVFKRAFAEGEIGCELEGKMIDEYSASKAQELLDFAAACAERDAERARFVEKALATDK